MPEPIHEHHDHHQGRWRSETELSRTAGVHEQETRADGAWPIQGGPARRQLGTTLKIATTVLDGGKAQRDFLICIVP